ncbi:hypothetical protein M758_9G114200 [Ceratodon purpureus]|nr:hypothetical protein M758_9G114200 [Ceratodon purpureus]
MVADAIGNTSAAQTSKQGRKKTVIKKKSIRKKTGAAGNAVVDVEESEEVDTSATDWVADVGIPHNAVQKKGSSVDATERVFRKFKKEDKVYLLDPKDPRNKVAIGAISGVDRDLFHLKPIPSGWLRVDVLEVFDHKIPLMKPHEPADQFELGDTIGGVVLWKRTHVVAFPQR